MATPPRPAAQPSAPSAAAREAAAGERVALEELGRAFGSLLSELSFSFVVSCARSPDMPIVFASPQFYACTGYSPAEVLGRNCRFLQGPATAHQSVLEIRDAIREERPCSICLLNYRKDKTPFWNYFRLEPVRRDPAGPVDWFVGVQADVTRLVEAGGGTALDAQAQQEVAQAASVAAQLAAHEAELTSADHTTKCAVLQCVPSSMLTALAKVQECFCLSDPNLPDCPIVFASPAFLRMTGYPCSEVVGRNCRFLQGPGTDPAAVQQLRDALAAQPPRPVTVTLLNYRKDGRPFWNSLHVCPLRDADGRVQFFAGVQMEITEEGEAAPAAAVEDAGAGTPAAAEANGAAEVPQADPMVLLRQKGVVGSLRVATRALAQHGLRRASQFQHTPCKAD
ncbi:LOV domain-containing [Chlorella sorokiniana]|uniref:LOV domain-containing n=1 Tax=Chlorella sorokiniana TaxID=3076 RepID=A0A2P6U2Y0_CHLSO|nr:LOV domain-containing [Chlorella sorokiniana]|eukprot:PRW60670.1 LOV domain-containing [Chlorella sorokiniana]